MSVIQWIIYATVYLGSILMVYNIYCFVRFARYIRELKTWNSENRVLYIPIVLLVCFLLGYLMVGFFGKPDAVIAGILFGGSVFVYFMYRLLSQIVQKVIENEHLAAQLSAAEEINRTKTRFLASMSHEMRTPMNVIIGLDTVLLKEDDLKPQMRERLEKIDVSAHHLLEIIDDVLNMNYIDSGDMRLKNERFSLAEALELIDMLAQSRCDEKNVSYRSKRVGEVDRCFIGDSLRLRQALVHVLDNAIKFTPEGGTVSFKAEQSFEGDGTTSLLKFTISDTGIGIDEAFIPRIFEAFSQEDASTTNRFGGSGLGMTIAKRLIDLMGGEITVSSEKGKGSTFVITVHLETLPRESAAETGESAGTLQSLEGRHILIVEDIDINAELVADLLELEGVTTERAENGREAVERFIHSPVGRFDAILMDLRMPVMDGLDATRAIRALDRADAGTVPIIALTANSSNEDVKHSIESGMNAHQAKPVDSDLLYDTLKGLIK